MNVAPSTKQTSTWPLWLGSFAVVMGAMAFSCGGNSTTTEATTTNGTGAGGSGGEQSYGGEGSWEVDTGSGGCESTLYEPPVVASPHVEECSVIEYLSNPPTNGPHYPRWANYQNYDEAIPLGYLVHAMEHGAVVLAYNCDNCDAEITAMETFVAGLEQDDACVAPIVRRVILVPMPSLDVPFAVAAWGFMLKAQCFDETIVAQVVADRYAKGPEDLCGKGVDPLDPDQQVPADCGQ